MPAGSRGRRFPKEERVLERRDFLRAQTRGKKVTTAHLIGVAVPSRVGRRRLGLTVSSKVGNAVERNQVKRWLREIYRHERDRLPECIDLVLIARSGAARAGYWPLRDEFLEIASRLSAPTSEKGER